MWRVILGLSLAAVFVGCSGEEGDDGGPRDAGPSADDGGGGVDGSVRDGGPGALVDGGVRDAGMGTAMGCLDVTGDAELAIDLIESVAYTGDFTSNAMELPEVPGGRGLLFFDGALGTRPFAFIPGTGASSYALDLVPDTYAVEFVGTSCSDDAPPFCGRYPLREELFVAAEGDTPFELARVAIDGRVTVDGAALPDTAPTARGRLAFIARNPMGGFRQASVSLGQMGDASYSVELAAGTYDVVFIGDATHCLRTDLPCNVAVAMRDVDLTAARTLDIDLSVAVLSGTLTQNGGALAEAPFSRGQIVIDQGDATAPTFVDVEAAGPATYVASVVPGTYSIRFRGLNGSRVPALPIGEGVIATDVEVTTDRTLDLDLETARISGIARLDGALLPDVALPLERGRLAFVDRTAPDDAAIAEISLGASGPAIYDATLFAGTYDVVYTTTQCLDGLPCTNGVLFTDRAFAADETLSVELTTHRIRGTATLDGARFPDAAVERGGLTVIGADGSGTTPLGATGAADFDVRVFAGDYVFVVEPPSPTCSPTQTPGIPCTSTTFATQTIAADTNLDFDVSTAALSGRVTMSGAALPTGNTGALRLYAEDGRVASYPVAADGAFSILASHGRYDVEWYPGPTCAAMTTAPRACASHYVRRCR